MEGISAHDAMLSVALRRLSRCLPATLWQQVFRGLGWWIGALPMRDVRRCREHLARAYPERDALWHRATSRRVFAAFGRMAGMTMAALGRDGRWAARQVIIDNPQAMRIAVEWLRRPRGVIVFTGHLGNWELMGRAIGHALPLSVIGKKLRSARADAVVRGMRTETGARQIDSDADPRQIMADLRQGRLVAILNDQDIERMPGAFVPWFGHPAYTPVAPGVLSAVAGAWCIAACYFRDGHWRMHIGPLHHPPRASGDRDAAALRVIAEATAEWEALVRRMPTQWAWWHRRWRTTIADKPDALRSDSCETGAKS